MEDELTPPATAPAPATATAPATTDMAAFNAGMWSEPSVPSSAEDLDAALSLEPSLLNIGLIIKTLMHAARRQQQEHGARMAALDARLKEVEEDGADEETLFSEKAGAAAIGAFGKLALRGKRAAKLKAEEALKQEIQAQVVAAVAVAQQESEAKQAKAAIAAQQQAAQQAARQAKLLAIEQQEAGEAGQEAAVAAALAAQQQAQLLAQQELAEQQAAQAAQQAIQAQQGQGQLAQQQAQHQARQERVEASLAAVVEMLCVEEVNEEGGYLSMKERAAIPVSERASKVELPHPLPLPEPEP